MPAPIAPRPAKPTRSIWLNITASHLVRGARHRFDDPEIARAAAEVACERLAQLLLAGVGVLADERLHRHQKPGRAKAALKRMRLVEGALEGVWIAAVRESLDGAERTAVRLNRKHQAGPHRFTVELDGAGAAHTLLAADLRARQPGRVPDEVRQERPRLDVAFIGLAIDLHADPHAIASSIA